MKIPSPIGSPGTTAQSGAPAHRSGLVLRDPLRWDQLRQVIETVEDTEYDSLFVPEIAGREAFATLAAASLVTSRLLLGTGVVSVHARNPRTTAMAAATIHELSGGRMVLGIGSGGAQPGAATIELVRGYVHEVRRALDGARDEAEPSGRTMHDRVGMPPIWLGALGDRMISLAGEVADGVILNWCTPERVGQARDLVARAARAGGRKPGEIMVAVYVRACLGVAEDVGLRALKAMASRYAAIPQYGRQLELMGLGEEGATAAKAFREGRPEDVPEALVRALTVTGGRREATARFDAYRQAGADVVLCYPVAALDPLSSILGTVMAAAPSPSVER